MMSSIVGKAGDKVLRERVTTLLPGAPGGLNENKMTTLAPKTTDYRDQIQRCAQTMALGYAEDVRPFLASGMTIEQVKLFTDGNLDKRFEKVLDQVELLKAAFDNLNDLVDEYILEVPLAAYD